MESPKTPQILWPPEESTRQAIIKSLTVNLAPPSIWSTGCGLLVINEAKKIEFGAYSKADQHLGKEADGDGSSAMQLYCRLLIEAIKGGPERSYRYRELRDSEKDECFPKTFVVQLTLPPTKDQSAETIEVGYFFTVAGVKVRNIYLSNNAVSETHIGEFDALLAAQDPLEDLYLLKEEVGEKVLNLLKKAGTEFEHTKLRISGTSFCREAAAVVAKAILSFIKDELTHLELSDFVSGRPDDEALEVMDIFSSALEGCKLQSLKLSNIAVLGLRAFGKLLKSQIQLEELYLLNVGLSRGRAEYISEIVSTCPQLEDFRCLNSRVYSLGNGSLAKALGKCNQLKKLDLRYNPLLPDARLDLSRALSALSGLCEIYLSHTDLFNVGCIEVAKALKKSAPSLQVLDMAGNGISDEAAPALASCIASKRSLTKLNLGENSLKDEGAIIIAKELQRRTHNELCEVDVHKNMIGSYGATAIAKAVLMKPLKVLNITHNHISPNDWRSKVEILFWNRPHVLVPLENESG
ncbi:hypothetical protein ACS0TY_007598 [Phlomoides rotata]